RPAFASTVVECHALLPMVEVVVQRALRWRRRRPLAALHQDHFGAPAREELAAVARRGSASDFEHTQRHGYSPGTPHTTRIVAGGRGGWLMVDADDGGQRTSPRSATR